MGLFRYLRLRKLRDKFLSCYKLFLMGSRWSPLLADAIKISNQALNRQVDIGRVRRDLKADNPWAWFREISDEIKGLDDKGRDRLRKMIAAQASKQGVKRDISKVAFSFLHLLSVHPPDVMKAHFTITTEDFIDIYDSLIRR
jgi:hypothetical protein